MILCRWFRIVVFVCAGLVAAIAVAAELPTLTARVTDLTGTLHAQQVATLEAKLASLEQRKGSQVAVVVVPTTQPETIEQYAVALFEQNAIGRKGVDDGVLLLVAKDDRRARIEVGYGLEGAIPDVYANRILDTYVLPKFRAGDFEGGIVDGVGALEHLILGEALPPVRPTPLLLRRDLKFMPAALVIAAVLVIFGNLLRILFPLGVGVVTAAALAVAAGVYYFGNPNETAALFVFTFFGTFLLAAMTGAAEGGGHSSYRVASGSDGSSGRSSGGGGSSGGSWSGGGGRSGGGGASGSW